RLVTLFFTPRERSLMCGLHLLADPLICLLRTLTNQRAVPVEFVPPVFRFFLFIYGHEVLPEQRIKLCLPTTREAPPRVQRGPPAGRALIQSSTSSGLYRTSAPIFKNLGPRRSKRQRRTQATLT